MNNTNTNTKPNASKRHAMRGPNGRFVSQVAAPVSAPATITIRNSSFIQDMNIRGDFVDVIMTNNPKITYTYKLAESKIKSVEKGIRENQSLGNLYNKYVKGQEFSRTIYR